MLFFVRSFLPDKTNINFIKYQWFGFIFSGLVTLISIIGLFTIGLNFGIDFKGGILLETRFSQDVDLAQLRSNLNSLDIGEVTIQTIDNHRDILIKSALDPATDAKDNIEKIKNSLLTLDPQMEVRKSEYVGGEVGDSMIKDGLIATIFTLLGIMIYVWIRFTWQYSIGISLSLFHDVIATLGFLVFSQYEFNVTSIAAILTVVGYSVNDTVVIYDRIRENFRKKRSLSLPEILNASINETATRSVLTLVTVLLAALALILFGGEALHSFSVTIFVGILIGAYSSLFISVPIIRFLGSNKSLK
jgi:preprotein translocase subunit SecF